MKSESARSVLFALILLMSPALAWGNAFTSAFDLNLSAQTISTASAGRDIQLSNVSVEGPLSAGRNISCQGCTISGGIQAGRDVLLEQCQEVRHIAGGRNVTLNSSHVLDDIASGRDVTLHAVQVDKDVRAGNEVQAEASTIQGLLSLGGHYLRLNGSTVGEVRFVENSTPAARQTSIISIGHTHGGDDNVAAVRQGSSGTYVQVGPKGLSSVNGYTIQGATNVTTSQTTIITPDQTIYVNGLKVSGSGPKLYADYRNEHPGAPQVHGPGWRSDDPAPKYPVKKTDKHAPQEPVNILDLLDHSVITGQVTFESGYGKIRVYPGAQFKGKVVNGIVENVPPSAHPVNP